MEEGRCAGCGALFTLNPRSRGTHTWCSRASCQRTRKASARAARRERTGSPTKTVRRERAAYMRRYRESRPEYRAAEAAARRSRRESASSATEARAVTSSGLTERAEAIYVEAGTGGAGRLHVVTEAGSVATVALEGIFGAVEVERRKRPAEPIGA